MFHVIPKYSKALKLTNAYTQLNNYFNNNSFTCSNLAQITATKKQPKRHLKNRRNVDKSQRKPKQMSLPNQNQLPINRLI